MVNIKEIYKFILVLIHLIIVLFLLTYIFIRNSLKDNIAKRCDITYVYLLFIILFNWLVFKDECFITGLYKRIDNNNYIMGENGFLISDIDIFLGKNIGNILMVTIIITILCTFYKLFKINNISFSYIYLLFFSYVFYLTIIRSSLRNTTIHEFIKLIMIIILVITLRGIFKKM